MTNFIKFIQKNKSGDFARVRIIFFRNEGGFYSPKTNKCSYIIQTTNARQQIISYRRKSNVSVSSLLCLQDEV